MKTERYTSRNFILRPAKAGRDKKEKWNAVICDSFFLWLFLACFGGWFAALFGLKIFRPAVILAAVPLAFLMMVLLYEKKKIKYIGIVLWCLVLVLTALLFSGAFVSGKNILLNQAVDTIGRSYPYFLPEYPVTADKAQMTLLGTLVYIWAMAFAALLGAYLVLAGNRLMTGTLLLLSFAVQSVSGIYAPLFWNLAGTGALLALWIRSHGENLPANRTRLAGAELIFFLAAAAALFFGIFQIWLPLGKYEKNEKAVSWKERILSASEERKYGGDAQLLPEGNFENLGSFAPEGKEALSVTMSEPESYYLRGYTGSVYTGDGWEETENEKRWESRDLFFWLHEDGYYGQEALALAAEALGEADLADSGTENSSDENSYSGADDKNTIVIENIGASSKYCYVPYELLDSKNELLKLDGQKIGDEGLFTGEAEGSRSYAYRALSNQVINYPTLAAKLLDKDNLTEAGKAYQKLEGYYNEYVYDTYLDVPINIRRTLSDLLGEADAVAGEKHISYADAKQNILYVLSSRFTYSEELAANWNGADFIYEFLNITESGYSVHYASAAVMMFRYYGIPARYVEGYLITPEDARAMTAGEAYILDDTHSHAWVEFYQDGIGWLPFEVTPSYLNVMKQAEDFQDISGVSGDQLQEQPQEEDKEEETDGDEASGIDWLRILEIVFIILICILILIFFAFIIWIFVKRRQSKKAKKDFDSPDMQVAIRSLFNYSMNILVVSGLKIRNVSLYRYERQIGKMFDEEAARAYQEVVDIRQEAVYSMHAVTEDQKEKLVEFKNRVWERVYKNGSWIQRFQLKYIYFL